MSRYDYRGAAAALGLANDLGADDLTFVVTGDTSGWPSGASGRLFNMVIDRGTAKEEKVLCASLAAGTVTVSARGDDGTSAKTHSAGAVVEHYGPSASKMDDLDGHVYDPARDDHPQYLLVNGTRAFTGVNSITGTPVAVGGDTNASGSSLTLARSDHQHGIAPQGINDSAMFAPGVVVAPALGAAAIDVANGVYASGQRPRFVVADSTALAALVPVQGDVAYLVAANADLVYDGTAWTVSRIAPQQTVVTGGPTSGTTELTLATLTIAALPATYQVECSAHWTPFFSVAGDEFNFRIKVDGTQKAGGTHRAEGTNDFRPLVLPSSTLTTIAVNTATTIAVTVQRIVGTGTVTEASGSAIGPGVLTARLSYI